MAPSKAPDRQLSVRPAARPAARAASAPDTLVELDPKSDAPLYRQIYDGVRRAILAGRLAPGTRLPSTRTFAAELGVARVTTALAFDQLRAEGYIEGRARTGTFVARAIPDVLLTAAPGAPRARLGGARAAQPPTEAPRLSACAAAVIASRPTIVSRIGRLHPFRTGTPALDVFPARLWARLAARRWRRPTPELLAYGAIAGHRALREAIAAYAAAARGARCTASQVIVTSGSQQALDLAARVLLNHGDAVWTEDPGYTGARNAFLGVGAAVVPVRVDEEGLDIAAGVALAPRARMVYVTPSHQFPLGVTMSASRRLALLEWARGAGAWIVEDDYDSELRYASRPLASLQGMDESGRVLYVGTFSKTLFPALRLGYLIVPDALVDAFLAVRAAADRHAPTVDQAVLADFIGEGHFARHVRRMRALYAERQRALLDAVERTALGEHLEVRPADAGMQLIGWLRDARADDRERSITAAAAGVEAIPLSAYAVAPRDRGALILGYAAFAPAALLRGAERLAAALGAPPSPSRARPSTSVVS
ncbi:MAG TPA: PLP-dependent aminotransferase family protein [Gemmatimonadaceae bacterium]